MKICFHHLQKPPNESAEERLAWTEALPAEGEIIGEAPHCPNCGRAVGMREWLPPYRVELETWGHEFGDWVFSSGDDVIVSERFKRIYDQNSLSGLSGFDPVEIVKVKRHRKIVGDPPKYFKVAVVRSRTTIDQKASGFVWGKKPTCPECREGDDIKRWKRIIIDPKSWTGEDVFEPRGLSDVIASDRFKEVCQVNGVKSAYFIPAEEYAYDFYPWERKNWEVLHFDETVATLRMLDKGRSFNPSGESLAELRKRIAGNPKLEWSLQLIKHFGARRKDVEEALSKAYYRIQRTPRLK